MFDPALLPNTPLLLLVYPIRNNAPLGFESQRLEFLTGFIPSLHLNTFQGVHGCVHHRGSKRTGFPSLIRQ